MNESGGVTIKVVRLWHVVVEGRTRAEREELAREWLAHHGPASIDDELGDFDHENASVHSGTSLVPDDALVIVSPYASPQRPFVDSTR